LSIHSPLQAVIFDCDGILVDTEPLHYAAFQEVLRPLGLGFDYALYMKHYIGFDDRDAFTEVFRSVGKPLETSKLSEFIHAKEAALQTIVARGVPTFPGVVELVRELATRNVPLAVASGALQHEVQTFVSGLGLQEVFQVIVAADQVEHSKPDPETYVKALGEVQRHFGLPDLSPRRCVAIEDTPAGIRSAMGAGLFVVGVAHSYPSDQLKHEADYVVGGLPEFGFSLLSQLVDPKSSHRSNSS
jgi:beta-phosphoglucomutase